ncbi:aminoacyl-tRNA hydrolase [bacterium]|nr:aminoacyl-tRNA hydrolase [bacterium]
MIIIAGLGNIGEEYKNTKHNIGFMTVDKIADDYNFPEWKEKNKYLFTKTKINDTDVILLKPTTYMNLSGEAVQAITTLYKIKPEDIIVIHDDLDLKTGVIKTKQGGGTGGHNGLKSIDSKIGNNYHRIRIGISHPRDINPNQDVASYVLSKFSPEDMKKITIQIENISKSLEKIIKKDFSSLKF